MTEQLHRQSLEELRITSNHKRIFFNTQTLIPHGTKTKERISNAASSAPIGKQSRPRERAPCHSAISHLFSRFLVVRT